MLRAFILVALMGGIAGADGKVTIRTAKDNSHTVAESESKKLEEVMRHTIEQLVVKTPLKLDGNRNVDASLVSLTTDVNGKDVIVNATLRVMVSDDNGRITSVLGGSAKVEALGPSRAAALREDAVVGAIESGYAKVSERINGKPRVVASTNR